MSSRPNPPAGTTEETSYIPSDRVYYFRSGTSLNLVYLNCTFSSLSAEVFRCTQASGGVGEIKEKGGSSETAERYLVGSCLHMSG